MKRSGGDGPLPIRVARGARAVEAALLAEIALHAEEGIRDPSELRHPVRVIVPSRSLREHLIAAMLRHFGGAIAGISVQTLHAVALEIVDRCSDPPPHGEALYPILVRRHARAEPALSDRLEDLLDGYRIVTDDVSDLLDAGFEAEHADAVEESLAELSRFPALVERAQAVVRVAARTSESMGRLAVGHRSRLLRRARELLERDPATALPARAVLIHGFAEATALCADLLEVLVRQRGARVHLDEPPDPANPSASAAVWRFSERLRARLAGVAPVEDARPEPAAAPVLAALEAPGAHAEVRAVAERIAQLLAAGDRPEGIGVVSRDIARYRTPLRLHFDRLGIPFSGVRETGSVGATWRRLQALLDLLHRRGRTPADRWLDAVVRFDTAEDRGARSDLRLGLRRIGVVRLEDVAEHTAGERDVPLPAIGRWRREEAADAGGGGARAGHRVLRAEELARCVQRARRVCEHLERLQRAPDLGARLDALAELLAADLGWERERIECAPVFEKIEDLRAELPRHFELDYDEFLLLLGRALEETGRESIGGSGGGVQVLNAMEARTRTFEALFLLGLNRDVFPRSIGQDPLLPDVARRAMAAVLPEIPIKATGYDEERYLFAQLLSASPRVTLSWQLTTDDGKDCAPSTLVERLRWSASEFAALRVPPLYARPRRPPDGPASPAESPRTLWEQALFTGLFGTRSEFASALPLAFAAALERAFEGADAGPAEAIRGCDAGAAASGRLAVLEEIDPASAESDLLGPYFGFVGAISGSGDPRCAPLYVTAVERLARCSWQAFVANLLRVEAPPDPLEAIPGSDPRLVGMVVHRVLERVVRAALGDAPRSLEEVREREPVPLAWPDDAGVLALASAAAESVLDDEGIALRGLARVLALQALPFLERARAFDCAEPAAGQVVGAELEGVFACRDALGESREIRFRADRADARDGGLLLTDYKTGRPISDAVRPEKRREHLLNDVARGRNLQAVAYALAAGGAKAAGRFVFLRPDLAPEAAVYAVRADAAEFAAAFESALRAVWSAWDAGAFFPRLVQIDLQRENPECERCELAAACLRGDSGARRRIVNWIGARSGGPADLAAPERALLELWSLHANAAREAAGAGK